VWAARSTQWPSRGDLRVASLIFRVIAGPKATAWPSLRLPERDQLARLHRDHAIVRNAGMGRTILQRLLLPLAVRNSPPDFGRPHCLELFAMALLTLGSQGAFLEKS
jgi:hypothetical protein